MTQKVLDKIRKFYEQGLYKKEQIDAMLAEGKITEVEYHYILQDVN